MARAIAAYKKIGYKPVGIMRHMPAMSAMMAGMTGF